MSALNVLFGSGVMGMLTIRNLPDDVYRALRVRAALHGRSTEAEVREILAMSVKSESHIRLGDALAELGRKIGITDEDALATEQSGARRLAEPLIGMEIECGGEEIRIHPARRPLTNVLKKFARLSPNFMSEERGDQEQADRDEL
jgi:plasmid stability protein